MRATQEGFIGIALTNSSPAMAALGGWRAVLGANPWSIAVPRGPGKWPLVLDIANTIVARGRIKNAAVRGETLPADWALDCQGKPTTDPTEAVNGSLFPFGGHKGYAIAFMMEALTAAIAGSAMSVEVQAPIPGTKGHQGVGQVFAAINPAVAISQDELEARLDLLIAYMETLRPRSRFWCRESARPRWLKSKRALVSPYPRRCGQKSPGGQMLWDFPSRPGAIHTRESNDETQSR